MSKLEKLAVQHPYYCHESNYYSNEPSMDWETMTDFLDEFEDADIDMNLVFRWDVKPRDEYHGYEKYEPDSRGEPGGFFAEVFIMHQRKGIFAPHYIAHITEEEVPRFRSYIEKHWEVMQAMWGPLEARKQDQ